MRLTIEGIQQAQAANLQMIAALTPSGALGRAIKYATIEAHRYALAITHVDTGALRASHRMSIESGGLWGRVYIDPMTRNPRTGQRTAVYGPYEHARGGSHAFYERVVTERGEQIVRNAGEIILRGLP